MRLLTKLIRLSGALLLLACSIQAASWHTLGKAEPKSTYVSMISLLANPGDYNGTRLSVDGVLNLKDHDDCLYPSREWAEYSIAANCIVVRFDLDRLEASREDLQKFDGKYVLVVGTFSAEKGETFFPFPGGSINDVGYLSLSPRDYPESAKQGTSDPDMPTLAERSD